MSEDRTPCAVPFCHRSLKGRWAWWLCKEHYAGVSLHARARHRKAKAYCKRRGWIRSDKKSWGVIGPAKAVRLMDRAGRLVIQSAIRRATGL